jgi:hypothetical protein
MRKTVTSSSCLLLYANSVSFLCIYVFVLQLYFLHCIRNDLLLRTFLIVAIYVCLNNTLADSSFLCTQNSTGHFMLVLIQSWPRVRDTGPSF